MINVCLQIIFCLTAGIYGHKFLNLLNLIEKSEISSKNIKLLFALLRKLHIVAFAVICSCNCICLTLICRLLLLFAAIVDIFCRCCCCFCLTSYLSTVAALYLKMPANKTYNCKKCSGSITKSQGSVNCKGCSCWFHGSCAGIAEKDIAVLKTIKSYSFVCDSCEANINNNSSVVDKINTMMDQKFESFFQSYRAEQNALKSVLDEIKTEMTSCVAEMKSSINDCAKRLQHVETVMAHKIPALETADNALHRKFNRCDFLIGGLPEGIADLEAAVISLGAVFNVTITGQDINTACYINNRKKILVKLNSLIKRDNIMKEYFKTRSLKVCDVITDGPGSDLSNRVYLNDHYTPAAGGLNAVCRNLRRLNVVTKFRVLDGDTAKAKLTFPDGREVTRSSSECALLLESANTLPS